MNSNSAGTRRPWYKRRRNQVLVALVIVLLIVSASSYFSGSEPNTPEQRSIDRAMFYFARNYNFTTGLIPEIPGSGTFWLYSDNYLVSLVISRYTPQNQTMTNFAIALYYAVAGYASTISGGVLLNQYTALNSTSASFDCSTNYSLSWRNSESGSLADTGATRIETIANNGSPDCATQNYADILFLQAVFYHRLGNSTTALSSYHLASSDFDGAGIVDAAYLTPGSVSFHEYQTYKLALYLYSAACLGQQTADTNYHALEHLLLLEQDNSTGGFYTGYSSPGQHSSSTPNTETTALAALALELLNTKSASC